MSWFLRGRRVPERPSDTEERVALDALLARARALPLPLSRDNADHALEVIDGCLKRHAP
jgi:hypothetical protein